MNGSADTCVVAAGAIALAERVVADVDELARRFEQLGTPRDRVRGAVQALTPYAATLRSA